MQPYPPYSRWRRNGGENDFIALMTWVEGAPLRDFTGVFLLLAEDQQESAKLWLYAGCVSCARRWTSCTKTGLVHGDVSPRNMLVSESGLVLIDYDFVAKIVDRITAPGTILYCPPFHQDKRMASPADDIYALAASFFHVVFEKEPFHYNGALAKERGLNWGGVDREEYAILPDSLTRQRILRAAIRVGHRGAGCPRDTAARGDTA